MVDTQVADIRIYTTNMEKAWSVINEAKLLCPRKKYQRIECTLSPKISLLIFGIAFWILLTAKILINLTSRLYNARGKGGHPTLRGVIQLQWRLTPGSLYTSVK